MIDTLEISVLGGSTAAAMADNFVFTPVQIPEPSSVVLAGISGLIGLGYASWAPHKRTREGMRAARIRGPSDLILTRLLALSRPTTVSTPDRNPGIIGFTGAFGRPV